MVASTWTPAAFIDGRLAPRLYQPEILRAYEAASKLGFEIDKVSSVCERVFDGNHGGLHPQEYFESGPLFIRNSYFSDLQITRVDHISDEAYDSLRSALKGLVFGDVLCAIKGDVGRAAVYLRKELRSTVNPPTACCRPGPRVDGFYLALQFESNFFKSQILALAHSKSTRPEVSVSEFRELNILVPEMEIQKAIGNKVRKSLRLSQLANLAESRMQQRIRQLLGDCNAFDPGNASDSWLTSRDDLEPRLDAEYYLPEYTSLLNHMRERVPVRSLGEIETSGGYGVLPPSDEYGSGDLPLIRGKDLDGFAIHRIPDSAPRVPSKHLTRSTAQIRPNQVMLLIKGATIAEPQSVSVVSQDWSSDAIVNGSIYKFSVHEEVNPYYLCAFMRTVFGLKQKLRAIANTGINYNDQDAIRSFQIAVPDRDTQDHIGTLLCEASQRREDAIHTLNVARRELESLLDGTMNRSELAKEDTAITAWLDANPLTDSEIE